MRPLWATRAQQLLINLKTAKVFRPAIASTSIACTNVMIEDKPSAHLVGDRPRSVGKNSPCESALAQVRKHCYIPLGGKYLVLTGTEEVDSDRFRSALHATNRSRRSSCRCAHDTGSLSAELP